MGAVISGIDDEAKTVDVADSGSAGKNEQPGKPPRKPRWRLMMFAGAVLGFAVAIVFAGAFASFTQYSNTMDFCISCHEMRSTVYKEFKESVHFSSRSGVHPVCADCHVPHGNWIDIIAHKVKATKELIAHVKGTVDTPEKFEAKRLELAKHEWARMKANDSAECRRCHSVDHWDLSLHKPRARTQHENMVKNGETCIDCHKGIAHKAVHEDLKEEEDEEESFDLVIKWHNERRALRRTADGCFEWRMMQCQ